MNGISYQEAINAYKEWARRTARNPLFGVVDDADEANPLVKLSFDCLRLWTVRKANGLPTGNELPTAVHSLTLLHKIRTLQNALANVAHQISLTKGVTDMTSF